MGLGIDTKVDATKSAISYLYSLCNDEVESHLEKIAHFDRFTSYIDKFFQGIKAREDFLQQLESLEDIVDSQIKIAIKIAKSRAYKKISTESVDSDGYRVALNKQGIALDPKKSEWDIPGYSQFMKLYLYNEGIEQVKEHRHKNLRMFISDLKAVFKKYGAKVTQIYINDFQGIILRSGLLDADGQDKYSLAHFMAPGILGGEDIVKSFRASIDNYGIVYSGYFLKIADLLPLDTLDKPGNLKFTAENLKSLKNKDRRYIYSMRMLLKASPQDMRFSLLEAISNNQDIIPLYNKLQMYKVSQDSFIDFLNKDINQKLSNGKDAFTFLDEMSEDRRLAPLAAALINADFFWYKDPNLGKLAEIAKTRTDAERIYRRYIAYSENGEENKRLILLTLEKCVESYQELHGILKLLDRADDAKLREFISTPDIKTLMVALREHTHVASFFPSKGEKKSFLSIVKERLDTPRYEKLEIAYHILDGYKQESRLKHVWINHPDLLDLFIEHIISYQSKTFELLMKSQLLFSEYLNQIKEPDFQPRLEAFMKSEHRNIYRDLHGLLLPKQPYLKTESEFIIPENENKIPKIRAQRILIYGGG